GGIDSVRKHGLEAIALGLAAGVGTIFTSLFLAPELSGAIGGLCATALFLARRRRNASGIPVRAVLPYAVLLAILAITTGVSAVSGFLEALGPVFTGPGMPLLLVAGFTAVLFKIGGDLGGAVRGTFAQWLPTAGAVLTFVLGGEVVAGSGAAALLASGAESLGALYTVASPVLGALGGALTGSNAASNALFMPLQVEAAAGVGISEDFTAAVQNVAGSHASLLAPQRMVLAATAVGLLGREGEILRSAIAPVVLTVAVLAVLGSLF
ncbi:MAG: L-lactate permease, partial [Actinomycetota bacterium]|nr:L-lactate permease [Actinomycetota bacterium]